MKPPVKQTRLAKKLGPSVVAEVRAIRRRLDEDAGHDLHRLAENSRRAAAKFRHQQNGKRSKRAAARS
jgi:hypothetical protein